ncbi:MAG: ABC transporter ATP-binding protein [Chloroflexota bacterium]
MIRASDLTKSYGPRAALAHVSFDVAAGSVTAVIGANGAGKSTLLRCLAGLIAHGGTATVERPIGYLPQGAALPPGATVREVRSLFAQLGGRRAVGTTGLDDRPAATLSGGQHQRAALAALFALAPRTLLLDEPTANLDDGARAELIATLHDLARDGVTIMLTSPASDAGELAHAFDGVLTLADGRLVSIT